MTVDELRAALVDMPGDLPVFFYDSESGPVLTDDLPTGCRRRWVVECAYAGADCATLEEAEATYARRAHPDTTKSVDGVVIQ